MHRSILLSGSIIVATCLLSGAGHAQVGTADANAQAGPVVNGAQITKEQFRALPPETVLDVQGKKITKAELLAEAKAKSDQAIQAQTKTLQAKAASDFEAARAKFLEQQETELQARNAKVTAEITRLKTLQSQFEASAAYKAIEKETADMQARYGSASPADRAKLQARAQVLHQQLRQMQASAVR